VAGLTSIAADSRPARVLDQLLDLLLVGILLGAPLIFYTRAHDVFEFNKITAMRDLSALAAVLLLAKFLFVRPLSLARNALDLPVLGWLAVALVATFNTVNWRLSVHGVYEDFEGITTLVNYAFLYYWASQHVRSERQIRLVLGAVALAGTVMGFYGLLQNFGIDFVPWNPDTYSKTRMFSTMGNPNFLAAYCVMSMPITFALFLDLPERIHTNKAFCSILIALGVLGSVGLCSLFNVNYFNFDPGFYEATSFGSMLVSQKFIATKVLLAFPLTFAVMMYFGRLRWIMLLSLLFQLISTLFTKSRGGVISMGVLGLIFLGSIAWQSGRNREAGAEPFWRSGRAKALALLLGGLALTVLLLATGWWQWLFEAAFINYRAAMLALLVAFIYGVHRFAQRPGLPALIKNNVNYLLALLALVWLAHYNEDIRRTTLEMLERFANLFQLHSVAMTPRFFIWRSALAMLRDHFWFGLGLDTFQISFPPYRLVLYWILEWNGTPEKAHNFVMQTAATMGFAGLLMFFWIYATFIWRSLADWAAEPDERRRLLLLAAFGAVIAFSVQNLFSFTVVGYGSLWWVLMGVIPSMARTWNPGPSGPAEKMAGASGQALRVNRWNDPEVAWKGGVAFLGLMLLTCALAGPYFFATALILPVRAALALAGGGALALLLMQPASRRGDLAAWVLWISCAMGAMFFAMHSTRIWVADAFYKQGQVGVSVGQPGYAAAMYQKAAGRLRDITAEQLNSIHLAETPTAQGRLQITPGLNPDQELYWVKMGIAFENAAAAGKTNEEKLMYYRTALAIHQYTLEMNPINGYNFNNKGRVLKSMGETFGDPGYYQRAIDHYDKAIALDANNAYFNLDKANTLLNLGRTGEAFDLCQRLAEKFTDFAVPRSYQGFIKMRAGQREEAIKYFGEAVRLDWKRDTGSRALAATNLGILQGQAGRLKEAEAAYRIAVESNPAFPEASLNLANLLASQRRRGEAAQVLDSLLKLVPNHPAAMAMRAKL
jgi:tetratricopeptide (TPR) repeat protein